MKTGTSTITDASTSRVVDRCQICQSGGLKPVLFLGYLPPVNTMPAIGSRLQEQPSYPAQVLVCDKCKLAQLGLIVDPRILFAPEYPYSSGTTKILRDNFAELYMECKTILPLTKDDLVIDVGSNDGTLLKNFKDGGQKVQGIEPTLMGRKAVEQGIPTEEAFFNAETAARVRQSVGVAKVITATNVFAHIPNVGEIIDSILTLLADDGVFVSESHYLISLIETLQYDTIYHEHLRYYSLTSLNYLLARHGLEIIHAKRIPTHGGSIRVYAARKGVHKVRGEVQDILDSEEKFNLDPNSWAEFRERVMLSKLELHSLLRELKGSGKRIYGVGAPSRASTLINYVGLDDAMIDCVVEVSTSHKIGKYMPGTLIPVQDEKCLFDEQPDYALLLSWHIADELKKVLTKKGFRGRYIIPLPIPRIEDAV